MRTHIVLFAVFLGGCAAPRSVIDRHKEKISISGHATSLSIEQAPWWRRSNSVGFIWVDDLMGESRIAAKLQTETGRQTFVLSVSECEGLDAALRELVEHIAPSAATIAEGPSREADKIVLGGSWYEVIRSDPRTGVVSLRGNSQTSMYAPWTNSGDRVLATIQHCVDSRQTVAASGRTRSSDKIGATCELHGPRHRRPKTFSSIRIGMTRTQVEAILGTPDYSPIEGQDYFSTPGECEIGPGLTAGCGYIIEYRDYSQSSMPDTGRVMSCSWGGIGE